MELEKFLNSDEDADVPVLWARLGLPGLLDVHVHFMPERLERRIWGQFEQAGPLIGVSWEPTYGWPADRRLARLAQMGVRAFPALAYAHKPDMAESLNGWTMDFARNVPGCLSTATLFPEPTALKYVQRALDDGVRLFKVHLQVSGYDPRMRDLDPVWGLLAEAGVPIVIHASSTPVPGVCTGPVPIGDVLARHPRLSLIVAHLGGPEYADFITLAENYEHVRLDTAMAFTEVAARLAPFPGHLLCALRDLGLAGKVLLGSDFPVIPYSYAHQLMSLERLGFGDDWLRAVLWEAAAGLFGLDG